MACLFEPWWANGLAISVLLPPPSLLWRKAFSVIASTVLRPSHRQKQNTDFFNTEVSIFFGLRIYLSKRIKLSPICLFRGFSIEQTVSQNLHHIESNGRAGKRVFMIQRTSFPTFLRLPGSGPPPFISPGFMKPGADSMICSVELFRTFPRTRDFRILACGSKTKLRDALSKSEVWRKHFVQ